MSQVLLCLAPQDLLFKWSLTTSPNPNSADLFQPAPKIKTSRAGKGKRRTKPPSGPFVRPACRISALLPSASLSPFPTAHKAKMGTDPAFLHEGQGKKLTFKATQSSPYSPASRFVPQRCKYAQPSCFPSSIKRYREGGKTAVTQAKNNPVLVNKMSVSFPSQFQHSTCSFPCFIWSKREKATGASRSMARRPGAGRCGGPGAGARSRRKCTALAGRLLRGSSSQSRTSCQQPALHFLKPSSLPERESDASNQNTKQEQLTPPTLGLIRRRPPPQPPSRNALLNPSVRDHKISKQEPAENSSRGNELGLIFIPLA